MSGITPKAIDDKPKENGQTDDGQQQSKVWKATSLGTTLHIHVNTLTKIFTNTANFISRIDDHVYMEVFELFESHELHLWNISLRMLVFSINPLMPANCLFEALDFIFGIVAVALCSRDKSIPFFVSFFFSFLLFCFVSFLFYRRINRGLLTILNFDFLLTYRPHLIFSSAIHFSNVWYA